MSEIICYALYNRFLVQRNDCNAIKLQIEIVFEMNIIWFVENSDFERKNIEQVPYNLLTYLGDWSICDVCFLVVVLLQQGRKS